MQNGQDTLNFILMDNHTSLDRHLINAESEFKLFLNAIS